MGLDSKTLQEEMERIRKGLEEPIVIAKLFTFAPGDYVRWHNTISGKEEYGQLRFPYKTQLGTHWAITRVDASVAIRTSRSQKDLTKVEQSEVPL